MNSTFVVFTQTKLGFNSVDPWNPYSNRHWSAENPMLVRELLVQSDKFGVWCAMSAMG